MANLTVSEQPCMMAGRDTPKGSIWYSATAHNHTVGISAPKGRKYTAKVEKSDTGVTLVMRDGKNQEVAAVAISEDKK